MSAAQPPLFRPQSLQSRETAWLGRPSLALGKPATFASAASLVLALATGALICFGTYTRRIDLHGTVLPSAGLIAISAPAAGWIEKLAVRDGATVAQGQTLYTLDVDTLTKDGGTNQIIAGALQAERAMLSDEIGRKQRMSTDTQLQLRDKITNLEGQLAQLADQIATEESFARRLGAEYTQSLALLAHRDATITEMDQHQQAWMQAQSSVQQLRGDRLRLQASLAEAQYQLTINPITTATEIDALRGRILGLDRDLASSRSRQAVEIRAPGAGTITAVVARPGQTVAAGAPMLTIVPKDDVMQAELLAPSTAIGFLRPGERVLLRYSAFPYQKFGQYRGTVVSVSNAALAPDEARQLAPDPAEEKAGGSFYRVSVKPDRQTVTVYGREQTLPPSMQVEADVLLEGRTLYEWIFEPLHGLIRAARGG